MKLPTRPSLHSITITDFRSIRGSITVPLNSPVVLIHGVNGAGKSTVLTAIELALTGKVESLAKPGHDYERHLVHRGQRRAVVRLTVTDANGEDAVHEITVDTDGHITGEPALSGSDRRTYVERCFLAQSTMSGLFDAYQSGQESPLTRFVKELLRLDALEAIIDGLFPIGHIQRLRNLLPEWGRTERAVSAISQEIRHLNERLEKSRAQLESGRRSLELAWRSLRPEEDLRALALSELLDRAVGSGPHRDDSNDLIVARQELVGLRRRVQDVGPGDRSAMSSAESAWLNAKRELSDWRSEKGESIVQLIESLRVGLEDVPSVAAAGLTGALRRAIERVSFELARAEEILGLDRAARIRHSEIASSLERLKGESKALSEGLSDAPDELEQLASTLASLLPFASGDFCPVCEREFSTGSHSIHDYISTRIDQLSLQAARLRRIHQEMREVRERERALLEEVDALGAETLSRDQRIEAEKRVTRWKSSLDSLFGMEPYTDEGARLADKEEHARAVLRDLRNRNSSLADIRHALEMLCELLKIPSLGDEESIEACLDRLDEVISERIAAVTNFTMTSSQIAEHSERLRSVLEDISAIDRRISACKTERASLQGALDDAAQRRELAKGLRSAAEDAQLRIVKNVFNHSLNRIWRDLFVRMVPTEPFVPAFRVETTGGRAKATLITVHRDGNPGGAPAAMLSAGNLNTGALTLFLALHISARPQLNWLVLDDPVQSMDEIHVAQLAALLRALAKRQDRRLIIAVHERSLFDYLSLELAPAFDGDRLISLEITRTLSGESTASPDVMDWVEDRALVGNTYE